MRAVRHPRQQSRTDGTSVRNSKSVASMPHSKNDLVELLDAAGIRPRRRWGQNFLIDLNLMRLLLDAAEIQPDDTVLEIGCGTGSMTGLLADRAGAVVAVDIDEHLARIAEQELESYANVSLICGDVLSNKNAINSEVLAAIRHVHRPGAAKLLMVSNLPYQVAGPLIVDLLLQEVPVSAMHVTVQAEVADRMFAQPGTKAYGLLSIMLQATGQLKRLRSLGPEAFWPRPHVMSTMLSWRRDDARCRDIRQVHELKAVIDLLLGHRRKKIRTCLISAEATFGQLLANIHPTAMSGMLEELQIDPHARGESLSPRQFVQLANALASE